MENRKDAPTPEKHPDFEAITAVLQEYDLQDARIFDASPVLRIQVSDTQFTHALRVRETLVARIKPLGFRFIALDLDVQES